MIFEETKLKGVFIIKPEKTEGDQIVRTVFSKNEFLAHGLNAKIVQCDIANIRIKGTFRGMHFQTPPFEEDIIVSCINGAFLNYVVDLRSESRTFKEWIKIELSAENSHLVYIPKSFAHGFYTLRSDTQVIYQLTQYHHPDYESGFRFDDPAFDIRVPEEITSVSERDRSYPDLYLLPQ